MGKKNKKEQKGPQTPVEQKKALKKKRRKRKLIMLVVEVILLLIVLAALYVVNTLNKIQKAPTLEPEELHINEDISEETQELLKGFEDVAIFGVDNRSNGNTDSGNSDVIMVASINNDTKEVRLISVYRDTFLDSDAGLDSSPNFHKANRAYAKGGAEQAVRMLNANLDLDIRHFMTVDFAAVTKVIDLLGGVEVEVDSAELKWINGYINTTGQVTGKPSSYLSAPGTYTLDGTQATAYCRIRYTAGNDYARAERQREVLTQIVKKAKSCDISTINKIINEVLPDVSTNYTNMQILTMASSMLSYELVGTAGYPFSKYGASLGGSKGDVVIPADAVSNVRALHRYLYDDNTYVPSATVTNYSSLVEQTYGPTFDKGDNPEAVTGSGVIEEDDFDGDGSSE